MKYLITQTQLEDIQALTRWLCFGECRVTERAIPTSARIVEMLEQLKPIEPLTSQAITEIWESEAIKGTRFGYSPFARAIERHILGGE